MSEYYRTGIAPHDYVFQLFRKELFYRVLRRGVEDYPPFDEVFIDERELKVIDECLERVYIHRHYGVVEFKPEMPLLSWLLNYLNSSLLFTFLRRRR